MSLLSASSILFYFLCERIGFTRDPRCKQRGSRVKFHAGKRSRRAAGGGAGGRPPPGAQNIIFFFFLLGFPRAPRFKTGGVWVFFLCCYLFYMGGGGGVGAPAPFTPL
jgi:hypothetical protein